MKPKKRLADGIVTVKLVSSHGSIGYRRGHLGTIHTRQLLNRVIKVSMFDGGHLYLDGSDQFKIEA